MTPSQAETVTAAIRSELNKLDPAVRAVYRNRWDQFASWCRSQGVKAAPVYPPDLARYYGWLLNQEGPDAVGAAQQAIAYTHVAIARALDVEDVEDVLPPPPPPARRGWWQVPRGLAGEEA